MQRAASSCKSILSVDSSVYIWIGFLSCIDLTQVLLCLLNYLWLMLAIFTAFTILTALVKALTLGEMGVSMFSVGHGCRIMLAAGA